MSGNDYTTARRDELAAEVRDALLEDVASGLIPATVEAWPELHEYVDANMYILQVMPVWDQSAECMAFIVEVEAQALRLFKERLS